MAEILQNTPTLRIDNILSIHPELGPTIPDGGYGWIILIAITYFELIIPNLLLGYGMSLMFSRFEKALTAQNPILDDILIYAPIFFMVARSITEPWCRIIIKQSFWPRLIATCGTCLTSAGVFLLWMERIEHIYNTLILISGGILSGIGVSLITCQCEVIVGQYFKLKLQNVNLIRQLTSAIGFIGTPILYGNAIFNHGVAHATLWYAVLILQGVVASIFLRKPNYYKNQPKVYNLVERTNSEDESTIFEKRRIATTHQQAVDGDIDSPTSDVVYQVIPSQFDSLPQADSSTTAQVHSNRSSNNIITKPNREEWETFEDDDEDEITIVSGHPQLRLSIEANRPNDLDRIDLDENRTRVEVPPSPIFTPLQQDDNNANFSFDDEVARQNSSRSVYTHNSIMTNAAQRNYGFLLYPTFYKSLLQIITTRFSMFCFMVFFPAHLYEQTDSLTAPNAVYLVGYVGLASMLYIIVKVRRSHISSAERSVILWFSCWIGCVGYLFVMAIKHETVMLIGAILIIISLNILTYIGEPLLLISPKGETNKIHASLSIMCGVAFLVFVFFNITFKMWFALMAFLLFSTGCVWFGNFYYKKTGALY